MKPLDYGSRKQKYETRQTPIATNTLNNAPTHQPIHPRCATAIQQSTADALMTQTEFCSDTGISMFLRLSATPGSEQTLPREAPARSPSRSSAPVLWPVRHRAAVWEECGATARPREAKWRSRVAAVFWVCYNHNIVKDPFWTSLLPKSII